MERYVNGTVFKHIDQLMKHHAFNAGMPWNSADEAALLALYDAGHELLEICKQLGRSPLGILERLRKLGKVHPHPTVNNDWLRGSEPVPTALKTVDYNTTVIKAIQELKKEIDSMKIDQTQNVGIGGTIPSGAYFVSNTATNPTFKESNTMTKPLEHKAFLFGNDITKLNESLLIDNIKRANDEINSYASIPDNNYTKLRIANLKDAIEAAVKELNKRGE